MRWNDNEKQPADASYLVGSIFNNKPVSDVHTGAICPQSTHLHHLFQQHKSVMDDEPAQGRSLSRATSTSTGTSWK